MTMAWNRSDAKSHFFQYSSNTNKFLFRGDFRVTQRIRHDAVRRERASSNAAELTMEEAFELAFLVEGFLAMYHETRCDRCNGKCRHGEGSCMQTKGFISMSRSIGFQRDLQKLIFFSTQSVEIHSYTRNYKIQIWKGFSHYKKKTISFVRTHVARFKSRTGPMPWRVSLGPLSRATPRDVECARGWEITCDMRCREMTCDDATCYMTWYDMKWNEMRWPDLTWLDMKLHRVAWPDVKWKDVTWRDVTQLDMTWDDKTWCDMTWD